MKNNKFLTSKGHYGIDFSQIDRVELKLEDTEYTYGHIIMLFVKNAKYPIMVLPYHTKEEAKHVYNQLKAVVDNTSAKVLILDNYRKD